MKSKTVLRAFGIGGLMVAATAFVGCDSKPNSNAGGGSSTSSLVGEIEIDGSSTVLPISNAVQEMFKGDFGGVEVTVSGNGTGNGFKRFYGKETDISGASRPIKPGELEECKKAGVDFVELPVAYDGLTIAIHPENDWATELDVDQLKKIFVGESAAKKWKDVDAAWPDEDINIFAPGTGSGTYDYFHEVLAKKDKSELRSDMNLNEDDNVLVQGVAGNKFSIGFFGVAYYEENKDKLQAVSVMNPKLGEAFLPSRENIATNKYAPFSRPLFIYVNAESLGRPEVQTFVDFYLNRASDLCEQVGYVRLPDDITASAKANFEASETGTHFVDDAGESRSGPLADNFKPENLLK